MWKTNKNETFIMDTLTCSHGTIMNTLAGFLMITMNYLSDFFLFHESNQIEFAALNILINYAIQGTIFMIFFYTTYRFYKDIIKKKGE